MFGSLVAQVQRCIEEKGNVQRPTLLRKATAGRLLNVQRSMKRADALYSNCGSACLPRPDLMRWAAMSPLLLKARPCASALRYGSILVFSSLALFPQTAPCINPHATLDQLKTLEITCFVPSWLPKGFKLKSVAITYDEPGPDEGSVGRFPLYYLEYSGPGPSRTSGNASFTIDSAREGIGDRNIMGTEDSDETQITSPFGPMYLIYTPKGQGKVGRKKEIKANWASDANMKSEKAKDPHGHPTLGRYHGFSATGITVAEFAKVIDSLRPIRP
jgi:hypothetical protein